ncbi:glycosyltransferase [Clostridium perfringens]|uniref:glycosyltransferase n=1 Tax=Clostridium perfringens TaxID=1502 RepID=UPI001C88A0D1|nr:glycosyltransferase [Clostridium perfringens]EHK2365149.1 glycosyltransferase [Clostridium perfringens]MDU7845409.1 glycosyltransferase [Clostridium perfringens]
MKILFIPWTFSNGGGSEKILSNLLNALKNYNFDISLFEIEKGHHDFDTNSDLFKYLGFLFKNTNLENSILYKIKRKFLFFLLENFPSLIRRFYIKGDFDIVISFNYLYPSFVASTFKGKKLMWFHEFIENLDYSKFSGKEKLKMKHLYKKQKKALEKANYIISISDKTESLIKTIYPEFSNKTVKIFNGYNFNEIIEKSNETSIDPIDIIAIGRLDENKNFSLLINSIKEVKKSLPSIKVKILGEGNERELLSNLIKENSLENNIELLGYTNNPYSYIKSSSLLVLTSKREAFPTVIVEAMSLNCPFVSTNVGGVKELSNNGSCGKVIFNEKDLSKTLTLLLTNKNLLNNMKKNCSEYVSKYSLENQATELNKLISSLF